MLLSVWLVLIWKGGTRGRTAALVLVPLLVISDQLSSPVIKELVGRARPCHLVGGVPGHPERSVCSSIAAAANRFPSSHAVNNSPWPRCSRRTTAVGPGRSSPGQPSSASPGSSSVSTIRSDIARGRSHRSWRWPRVCVDMAAVTGRWFPSLVICPEGGRNPLTDAGRVEPRAEGRRRFFLPDPRGVILGCAFPPLPLGMLACRAGATAVVSRR